MTLEKTISPSAFLSNNLIPRGSRHHHAIPAYSKLGQDNHIYNHRLLLTRSLSDHTALSCRPIPDGTWPSANFVAHVTDKSCLPKTNHRTINDVNQHPLLRPHKSDPYGPSKRQQATLPSGQCVQRKWSVPSERPFWKTQERVSTPQSAPCSRETPPHLPHSMPKSVDNSSRTSPVNRAERQELEPDDKQSLNPELVTVEVESPKKRRPHSTEERQKESTTTCSFFYFIRKKKKVDSRSPSPDKKSNRRRSNFSCSSAQSAPRSEQTFSPSDKHRRLSEQSQASSRVLHSVSSHPATCPPGTTPLLTSTTPPSTNKQQKYTSRSRPKHRRDRRHRTSKRVPKTHPDDRLKHEDLPPHPSLYKNVAVRSSSEPSKPQARSGITNNIGSLNNNTSNISDNITDNTNTKQRKDSRQESFVNPRSTCVSSVSGGNRKNSTADSALNLKDKSQHSASRTDLEEDSHYQLTTSSSDQLSRRTVRSQSLPSFRGDRFLPNADTKVISDAEDFQYNPTDMQGPLHLSLCGCGFLGMYHLGVISCLTLRGPSFLERVQKVGGASAGALMAAVLVTARDKIEESAEHVQNLAKEIRRKPLGAITPGYSFTRSLRLMLEDILPEDAHELAQGKLFVSLTNSDTKKNELMSDFRSRDELIEALVASCYIPVYAGIKLPTLRGQKFIDGGLSDNLPRFETGRTITVSPFDGRSDIGPKQGQEVEKKAHFISCHNQDIQVTMNNVKKGAHALCPPRRQTLLDYYEKGRYDAGRFLIREGLYEITNPPQTKNVLYESSV